MSYFRVSVCSILNTRCGSSFSQAYTSKALFMSSVPIHPRRLLSSLPLFWWSTHTMQQLLAVARCMSSSITSCASTPSLMSFTRSRMPSTTTRSGFVCTTASMSSARRCFHSAALTLNTSILCSASLEAVSAKSLFFRMSCVDSSLCSVSYQSTLSGSFAMRCSSRKQLSASVFGAASAAMPAAMSMLVTKVFPLLALPVMATSSLRGKQGLSNRRNRNSMGRSSVCEVILSCSSISVCGLSCVCSPA